MEFKSGRGSFTFRSESGRFQPGSFQNPTYCKQGKEKLRFFHVFDLVGRNLCLPLPASTPLKEQGNGAHRKPTSSVAATKGSGTHARRRRRRNYD